MTTGPQDHTTTDYGLRTTDRAPCHPSPVACPSSPAFTLIEIMIAITILALVITAIYSSWTAILRASKAGLDAAASVQRARIAVRTLEDTLSSVEPFGARQQRHPEYYEFTVENGNEAKLSFVARLAKSFPRSGYFGDLDVRRVTFSVDSEKQLVLHQSPLLVDPENDEYDRDHPLVLAKNVQEFKIQCWDEARNDWADEWDQSKLGAILPRLVVVTLQLADNSRSTKAQEEITRIVSLPATRLPPGWLGAPAGGIPNLGTNQFRFRGGQK